MKPFNLEAAKAGKPLITRDGRRAKFLAHVPEATESHQVVIFVEGGRRPNGYYENGSYLEDEEADTDLFMAPEKVSGWVNLYQRDKGEVATSRNRIHPSKEIAEYSAVTTCSAVEKYLGAVFVEIEV